MLIHFKLWHDAVGYSLQLYSIELKINWCFIVDGTYSVATVICLVCVPAARAYIVKPVFVINMHQGSDQYRVWDEENLD